MTIQEALDKSESGNIQLIIQREIDCSNARHSSNKSLSVKMQPAYCKGSMMETYLYTISKDSFEHDEKLYFNMFNFKKYFSLQNGVIDIEPTNTKDVYISKEWVKDATCHCEGCQRHYSEIDTPDDCETVKKGKAYRYGYMLPTENGDNMLLLKYGKTDLLIPGEALDLWDGESRTWRPTKLQQDDKGTFYLEGIEDKDLSWKDVRKAVELTDFSDVPIFQ